MFDWFEQIGEFFSSLGDSITGIFQAVTNIGRLPFMVGQYFLWMPEPVQLSISVGILCFTAVAIYKLVTAFVNL